jgi:alpha-galactosidase
MRTTLTRAASAAALIAATAFGETKIWLADLDLANMTSAWEHPRAHAAVGGNPFKIARKTFERGVGTHAESWFALETGGQALAFEARVGVDDEELVRGKGSVVFRVYADTRVAADSGVMRAREPAKLLKADLAGARTVVLEVSDAGDGNAYDHADWCDAVFTVKDGATLKPLAHPPTEQMGILTPPPPAAPRINGARVFGVRPGSPVLFTVPATGKRPLSFAAEGLPRGLAIDRATGIITGTLDAPGTHVVTLKAENAHGQASRDWRLEAGDRIALTPPMGWNSWNCFAHTVSDADIRASAEALKRSGLIDHGWTYINIDDYWQTCPGEKNDASLIGPARDAAGRILPNKRFPDMKALCDYMHGLGLKIGIYSSPGPATCGGCVGSWQHEAQDAQTYAEWGFDYLKYDWCSYAQIAKDESLKERMLPYLLMGRALRHQKRDIVFSLCQYGMGHVSAWGDRAGGHCWRTTGDITDTWQSMTEIVQAQDGLEPFARPGNWNDPDMLVVGTVGWGSPRPTHLTPNEQYTHISLWCLLSAPLFIGCDLTRLDAFTLNLLTNAEVIEVNQDPLGQQAARVQRDDGQEIWAKKMSDGSTVAGLFNRSCMTRAVTLDCNVLNLTGPRQLRDLWRQKDLGTAEGTFTADIPGHGVLLLKLSPP